MNNETQSSRFRLGSKIASVFLTTALLASTFTGLGGTIASAAEITSDAVVSSSLEAPGAGSYGLADKIEDGNILHCFNWKLSDIKAALPEIAEAGFTSIQTSPLQPHDASGPWYWLYQPLGFSIGNEIGSESDLKALCTEADKYGIKIVVDVVANHLAGSKTGEWKGNIQADLNDSQYFHNRGPASNWDDRNEIIYKNIGMPDLNTEHSHVIEVVANYAKALKNAGVDGIRWDAAKHIGLPSEGCNFWSTMAGIGLYNYGEILDGPAGKEKENGNIIQDRYNYNSSLMVEYSKYIGVTDENYCGEITGAIRDRKTYLESGTGKWANRGVSTSKLVYWAESHDTYCNNGWTNGLSQDIMDRAYAVTAARANSQTLYFSRPFEKEHESIHYGVKGSTHFTSKQVAAVNHFKNAMVGTREYFTTAENCFVICREGGAVIVNADGGSKQVTVPNGGGLVPAGTYTDEVSGSTWTVTSSTISGQIGNTGIAVFYKGGAVTGGVSLSPSSGSFTDTMSVTISAKDVSDASYTTSEGDSGSVSGSKTITIGSKTSAGGTVTVTVTGTKSDGSKATATGTYTKKDPNLAVTVNVDNSVGNWSNVYAYVYTGDGESAQSMAAWPGTKMTQNGQYYTLDVTGYENGRVIFNDGTGSASNRYPADMEPGLQINNTSMLFTMPNKWEPLPVQSKLKVSLSASPSTVKVGDIVTLTATPSNASGTVTYSYKAGSETLSSTGATATWTAKAAGSVTFTVTARDSANTATATATVTVESGPVEGPQVICDKASGTSFETETLSVNLTLKNAVSGTYSIDGGAVKKFTGPTTVAVGEGKIGDSTVTLTATATGSDGKTNTQTFTFSKKYKVKTTSSSAPSTCDKFVTNPNGAVGAKKTITSASDFTADTMIAKGIANDDPAAFKGPHEAPKFDLYALYAAWDDTNLYIGIQYTNVIDVVAPEQDAPQGGRGKPNGADADIPQMILLDVKSGDYTDGSTNDTTQKTVWNSNITFGGSTKVDRVIMYSPKDGINNWGVFPVKNGVIDYTSDQTYTPGYQKALAGASLTWEDGFFLDKMEGIDNNGHKGYTPAEIESTSSKWVDFLTTGHSKAQDTFCIMTMPLKYLGISANDISSNGIGVMAVATYGASGIGCLPYDDVMLDAATEEYSSDPSTSHEKEDADQITVALASVGKGGDNPPPPPSTPLQVNFGTDKAAPQLPTTKMTIKGIGIGGTAPYKYEFRINGKTVQASSSADTYSWTPGTAAKYTLECVVTDSTGKTSTSTKTFTAANSDGDNPPPPPDKLTASISLSATSVKVGTSVKITAGASGGSSPYQYAYFQKLSTASAYSTIKSYSTASNVTFTPAKAGTYTIKVKVKDSDGTVKSAVKTLKVASVSTTLTNKSTLSASMVKLGGTVTVNCAASGGTTPYQYAVFYKKSSSSQYTTVQSYKTNKTVTIKPGAPTVYNIRVKVKDAKGAVVSKDITVKAVAGALANTSKLSATSIALGSKLTVTGSATGGTAPYQYAVYYKKAASSSYTKARGYSTTTTVSVTPASATKYDVRVKVKDKTGKVVNKDFVVTVSKTSVNTALSNNSRVSSAKIKLGETVRVTCVAAGGTAPYKYAVSYKKASGTDYTSVQSYSTNKSVTIKPAAATTYVIRVKVKDAKGTLKTKEMKVAVTK